MEYSLWRCSWVSERGLSPVCYQIRFYVSECHADYVKTKTTCLRLSVICTDNVVRWFQRNNVNGNTGWKTDVCIAMWAIDIYVVYVVYERSLSYCVLHCGPFKLAVAQSTWHAGLASALRLSELSQWTWSLTKVVLKQMLCDGCYRYATRLKLVECGCCVRDMTEWECVWWRWAQVLFTSTVVR